MVQTLKHLQEKPHQSLKHTRADVCEDMVIKVVLVFVLSSGTICYIMVAVIKKAAAKCMCIAGVSPQSLHDFK
jgi:hypothetical protein